MSPLKSSMKCKLCHSPFDGYHTAKYCSSVCQKQSAKDALLIKMVARSHIKFPDGTPKDDYVSCGVCQYRSSDLAQHPQMHGLTQEQYRSTHGDIKCVTLRNKLKGVNNPAFNHGGRLSPFSKKFVNYTSDEDIEKIKAAAVQTKIDNNTNPLTLIYYTSKGYSESEAQELLIYRQSTFSLEKCISKYGAEVGLKRWSDRQEKWLNTLNTKTPEEIAGINRKKSTKINYKTLWNLSTDSEGWFYIIKISESSYKIGITSKQNLGSGGRYGKNLNGYDIILHRQMDSINHAFMVEQIIKLKFTDTIKKDIYGNKGQFGWTEVLNINNLDSLLTEFNLYLNEETAKFKFNKTIKNA